MRKVAKLLAMTVGLAVSVSSALGADETIIIGGALSMTGINASLDVPSFKGAQVAVKYLNEQGGVLGKQLEFINIDGKSDPVTVGNAAIELIDRGARVIIPPCDFDLGSPGSREAQAAGLVGISPGASDPLYSSWSLGDKQFTLSMWNTTMGAVAADYAVKEKGWKTAYVVTDQIISYTKSLSKYFIEQFKADGGEILFEDTYTNGDNNFSAQLARLQALGQKPDVIFVSSYGPDIAMIIRALREVGYDAPILGGDVFDDIAMHQALGTRFGNDIYFVTHSFLGAEVHPDMEKFIDLYTQMHDEVPDTAFASTGWDVIMTIASAMEAAGSTDGDQLAAALEQGQFDLLTGNLDYGTAAQGHIPNKAAALVALHEGTPQFVGWRKPESLPNP